MKRALSPKLKLILRRVGRCALAVVACAGVLAHAFAPSHNAATADEPVYETLPDSDAAKALQKRSLGATAVDATANAV